MEENGRIDPCETEIKNLRGGGEVNTYDSPIDPLSFSDKQNLSRKSKKGILSGIYKFAATFIVILTVIFAASELLDFLISDMGAENTILRRIFGSSASGEDGNLIEMILEQTFGELPIKPSKTDPLPVESTPIETPPAVLPEETPPQVSETPVGTDTPAQTTPPVETTAPPAIPDNAHPIVSMDMSLLSYGKSFIYNNTALAPNVSALISTALSPIETTNGPLVLVLHTHGTESFMPDGATYYTDEGELARSSDPSENMISVGEEFVKVLERKGIETLHCTVMHDKESYRESYARAAETIRWYLEQFPSIRYVFDLHRDSIMRSTEELVSAVTYINGERVAQVMPVIGSGYSGYENNLSFALKLREELNEKYGTVGRPVCLRESQYNQSLTPVSVLLEIGTSGNTLDEAKRAARITAEAVATLIKKQCS